MIRRILIILLALTLPLNGWAATRVVELCPMHAHALTHHAAMQDSCCKDQPASEKSANSCKAGQECQTSTLYFTAASIALFEFPSPTQPSVRFAAQIAATESVGVWRPPRS